MRIFLTLCALTLLPALGCGDSKSPGTANTVITAEDVAWAADRQIWKLDLSDEGPVLGVQIVVTDGDGQVIGESSRIGGGTLVKFPFIVTIAARKDARNVAGKLRLESLGNTGSIHFSFADTFNANTWGWVSEPKRNGDLFFLAAESGSIESTTPSLPEARKLALRSITAK